jgi:hypothetical protein
MQTWTDLGVVEQLSLQDLVAGRFRSALRVRDLSLLVIDDADRVAAFYPLRDHTVTDGFRFFEEAFGCALLRPEEPLRESPLRPDAMDLAKLSAMYAQAAAVLTRLRNRHPDATPARLWPHHFDIAVLIGATGVGFLAGDDSIDEPYWYVYNTPMPETLPPLSNGEWFRGHWTGAVLKGDPDAATIERFLDEAISAVRSV